MQNKGFVKVFAVLLTLVCLFYLSFTYVTSREDEKIEAYATTQVEKNIEMYANETVNAMEELIAAAEAHAKAYVEGLAEQVLDEDAEFEKAKSKYLKPSIDSVKNEYRKNLDIKKAIKDEKDGYLEKHKDDKVWLGTYTLQECRELQIGLGLDLRGGLSVTLEVSAPEFLKSLAYGNIDAAVTDALAAAQEAANNDAKMEAVVNAFVDNLPETKTLESVFSKGDFKDKVRGKNNAEIVAMICAELANAVDNSYDVVCSRIDRYGVAQPNIQKLADGQGRILVELPGADDEEEVKGLLTRSSNLQFWKTYTAAEMETIAKELERYNKGEEYPFAGKLIAGNGIIAYVNRADTAAINEAISEMKNDYSYKRLFDNGLELLWGADSKGGVHTLYAIKKDSKGLTGDVVKEASAGFEQNSTRPCVNMKMNSSFESRWADLTGECATEERPIAVVLDDFVYSAPVPSERISGGSSVINGSFTIKETQNLAIVLSSGKMIVPLRAVECSVVGPTIGKASVEQGMMSFIVAFILLMVYMCFVYGLKPGLVANGALLLNLFFTLGILASFQASLTMAGIAGIVLTLGMAVDANVLIYERAKEELKAGKNVRAALADGYKNAFSAILDSNLTSVITGIILYNFGTGPIKGFAVTLIIGLLCSFFTAVFVTRIVYERFHSKNKWMNLTFTTKLSTKLFHSANVNFMKLSKKVGVAFVVLALVMLGSFVFRGMAKSIEFTGGRNYVVKFEQKVDEADVQKLFKDKVGDANVQVISYGTDGDQVRISTNYMINDKSPEVSAKVKDFVRDVLKNDGNYAFTFESSQEVDSTIAEEISDSAIVSVILALIAIFIYILVRFRNVAYSIGAIFALALDVVMILGCYSVFNGLLPISLELDQIFIGAILTAIGYSINDKVVIFDRIREFAHIYPNRNKYELFNASLNTTLARTLNTSFSTLIVLLCIFFLGGDSIRSFSFAMILGVVFGTLSSIFVAAPVAYKVMQFQASRKAKKNGK